jgi:hypothetical protein
MMDSTAGMEALMGVPFALRTVADGDAATVAPLPPNLRMLITEYNVMERAGPLKLSWAHALFIASAALNLLAVPAVDSVMLHVLLNGFGWGALYETSDDFTATGAAPAGSARTAIGKHGCLIAACASLRTRAYAPTAVGTALAALSSAMQSASQGERYRGFRGPSGLRGPSLEPPGPLLTQVLHNVYMAYSECIFTRLNPLAERTCFSQARVQRRRSARLARSSRATRGCVAG